MPTNRAEAIRRDIQFYEREVRNRERLINRNPTAAGVGRAIDAQLADERYLDQLKGELSVLEGKSNLVINPHGYGVVIPVRGSHRARSHTRRKHR